MRIYPTAEIRRTYLFWLNTARFVYNRTMAHLRDTEEKIGGWRDTRKIILDGLPDWAKPCPNKIKANAVKEAQEAFFKTLKAAKGGKPATFRFRSRKDPQQSCYIPKDAIKPSGIYPRVSGRGLRYSEPLPESLMDSRLVWRAGKFFLTLPEKSRSVTAENQGRVVALDPGVRTFLTYYAGDRCGHIAASAFSRLQRLAHRMDDLLSRLCKAGKQRKRRMRLAAARMREKIKNLVDELHRKVALFLVRNFDVILLPTFETKDMTRRARRKIRSKTVRNLLSFAHFRFKLFLRHKAQEYGKAVVDVDEAYTSKTHPETGEVRQIGGAKRIRLLDGSYADRDIVGARNILLRALVGTPQPLPGWQLTDPA